MDKTICWFIGLVSSICGGTIAALITAFISYRKFKKQSSLETKEIKAAKSTRDSSGPSSSTRIYYVYLTGLVFFLLISQLLIDHNLYRSIVSLSLYIFIFALIPFSIQEINRSTVRAKTKEPSIKQKLPSKLALSLIILSVIFTARLTNISIIFWISYLACILPIVSAFLYQFMNADQRALVFKAEPISILPALLIPLVGATIAALLTEWETNFVLISFGLFLVVLIYVISFSYNLKVLSSYTINKAKMIFGRKGIVYSSIIILATTMVAVLWISFRSIREIPLPVFKNNIFKKRNVNETEISQILPRDNDSSSSRLLLKNETGTVKWFNPSKGYGFIDREQGDDLFFHYPAIVEEGYRELAEGDKVKFDIKEGPKGLQAMNVKKTDFKDILNNKNKMIQNLDETGHKTKESQQRTKSPKSISPLKSTKEKYIIRLDQKVTKIIVDLLGVDEKEVIPEASFIEDLGADSLDIVELVMALEKEFCIVIPNEDAEKIMTLDQAIDYLSGIEKLCWKY